jgi:hypothetical protein
MELQSQLILPSRPSASERTRFPIEAVLRSKGLQSEKLVLTKTITAAEKSILKMPKFRVLRGPFSWRFVFASAGCLALLFMLDSDTDAA